MGKGVDLAVRIGSAATEAEKVGRVVARTGALLCAAPSYLAAREAPSDIAGLAAHDRLLFGSAGRAMDWWNDAAPRPMVRERGRIVMDSAEALRDMALAGFGIAQLPRFPIADDLAAGRLAVVLPEAERPVAVSVLYATARHLPTPIRLFIDHLTTALGDVPYVSAPG